MRTRSRRIFVSIVVSVALLGVTLGTAAASSSGEILKGVSVGGVPVGGLEAEQAAARLEIAARSIEDRKVDLVVGERRWTYAPSELGIRVDLAGSVADALKAGRDNPFAWVRHTLGTGTADLTWRPKVDTKRFDEALRALAARVNVEASNGGIQLIGSDVKVRPPTEGIDLSVSAARQELLASALFPGARGRRSGQIPLPVTITPPRIDGAEVARIEQQARVLLRGPVGFSFADQSITLPPEKVAAALRVRVLEDPESPESSSSLVLQADAEALTAQLIAAAPSAHRPAKDASFAVKGDTATVIPSADGLTIDASAAAHELVGLVGRSGPIVLGSRPLPPELTTEQAQALAITKRISSFTTTFDPENAPRVANIDRMAASIDNAILRPGDSFSLNAATGPRTPANGYQEAGVIVDGEIVPGIGGGVCQVATTLFNAVFLAGLDVVERSNHSLHISKYPIGRDAMVNYGIQDLKFRNDTGFGLLMKATVTSKAMIVSIFSSPLGRTVDSTTSERTNPKPPSTKYIDDPTLPAGQEVVVEEGSAGFDIRVTRTVSGAGGVLHKDTFLSKYRPWKRIIRRGTGPAATPSPSPSPGQGG